MYRVTRFLAGVRPSPDFFRDLEYDDTLAPGWITAR